METRHNNMLLPNQPAPTHLMMFLSKKYKNHIPLKTKCSKLTLYTVMLVSSATPTSHLPVEIPLLLESVLSDTSAVSPNATVVIQPSATKMYNCYQVLSEQTGTTIGNWSAQDSINSEKHCYQNCQPLLFNHA